ncbi:hypothetical protein BpHYR1_011216 [Brachionus plicatilis]|uniref:Uncharacterized protein n=1 Tax=Brachionus plicatilis TaxID=10195 RepID=A0A3M7SNB3_BRAPC|nr:hypothetical protein BpHYR1_011216 [Brachionus plicatilis]
MKSLKTKFDKKCASSGGQSEQVDNSVVDQEDLKAKKIAFFHKKFDYENQNEADESIKYDSDTDEFEIGQKIKNDSKSFGKKFSSKYKKRDTKRENSNIKKEILNNQSDSVSSSESGFGTVDDDLDKKNEQQNLETTNVASQSSVKLESHQSDTLLRLGVQNSADCEESSNQTQISFPILQPPKLSVYELNRSDDFVNILNDNSSISTSTSSNRRSNCLLRLLQRIYDFLCSCFCCYTSNPQQNQPIFCSWLTIFCCCCPLLGGISLLLNYRSKQYKNKQKYELADRYSGYAEKLNIAALIFGVIFYAIGFFILTLVLFIYWKVNHF